MPTPTVGQIIIQQMGGIGRLNAMVGASLISMGSSYASFKFKGAYDVNYIRIALNPNDLYDVQFGKLTPSEGYQLVSQHVDVPVDNLKRLFEDTTGLYLTM